MGSLRSRSEYGNVYEYSYESHSADRKIMENVQ